MLYIVFWKWLYDYCVKSNEFLVFSYRETDLNIKLFKGWNTSFSLAVCEWPINQIGCGFKTSSLKRDVCVILGVSIYAFRKKGLPILDKTKGQVHIQRVSTDCYTTFCERLLSDSGYFVSLIYFQNSLPDIPSVLILVYLIG